MSSSERFGYEWNTYDYLLPQYEDQFLKWVFPFTKEDFKGKTIIDAGCGMGRNSYWPLQYGAKFVYAFDFDERSIKAARRNLRDFENVEISFSDIYNFSAPSQVDMAFSIGVIHHLHHPLKALANLAKSIKPGGKLLIWVYGYKGNEWIVKFVNPIRKNITSKLPVSLVHLLSFGLSIPLFIFVKLFKLKSQYLKQLKGFKFKHTHSIVFDQLIPEVANYWTKEEVYKLLSEIPGINNVQIYSVNGISWTVLGEKI